MHGLTRTLAATARANGWSMDQLQALHVAIQGFTQQVGVPVEVEFHSPFAFLVGGALIYKDMLPEDIMPSLDGYALTVGEATAYTDGSGTTAKKSAGVGVALYLPKRRPIFIAQNIGLGSNNRAELCAIWAALRAVPYVHSKILIRSDSEYAIGALTQDWTRNHHGALIEQIRRDIDLRKTDYRANVRFEHIEGHAGHEGNEIADQLSKIGRKLVTTITEYPTDGQDGSDGA